MTKILFKKNNKCASLHLSFFLKMELASRGKQWKYWREELYYFVKNMICASNWRLFRSKTWSVLRIDDFSVRNHELCFEFKTCSFEIMICASNSRLFRSKSWILFWIQNFLFEIMNYASISTMQLPQKWTKKVFLKKVYQKWSSGALRPASGSKSICSMR